MKCNLNEKMRRETFLKEKWSGSAITHFLEIKHRFETLKVQTCVRSPPWRNLKDSFSPINVYGFFDPFLDVVKSVKSRTKNRLNKRKLHRNTKKLLVSLQNFLFLMIIIRNLLNVTFIQSIQVYVL